MKKVLVCLSLFLGLLFMFSCEKHTHKKQGEYLHNETHHWYACEKEDCGERVELSLHNWNSGKVISEPTQLKDGTRLYVCRDCYATKEETIKYVPKNTVSSTQWGNAFYKDVFENVTAVIEEYNYDGENEYKTVYTVQGNGSIIYVTIESYLNGEEIGYIGKYQEGYSLWTFNRRDMTIEEAEYSLVTDGMMSTVNVLSDYGLDFTDEYENFKYDSATQNYTSEQCGSYKNISVKFTDGKITELKANNKEDEGSVTVKFSNYGKTEPTPPSNESKE